MLTDNEIIKALECCFKHDSWEECGDCIYKGMDGVCIDCLMCDALDLINRQKAENAKLRDRNRKCIYLSDEETTEYCVDAICPKFKTVGEIKTEAYKEFTKKFVKKIKDVGFTLGQTWEIDCALKRTLQELMEVNGNA